MFSARWASWCNMAAALRWPTMMVDYEIVAENGGPTVAKLVGAPSSTCIVSEVRVSGAAPRVVRALLSEPLCEFHTMTLLVVTTAGCDVLSAHLASHYINSHCIEFTEKKNRNNIISPSSTMWSSTPASLTTKRNYVPCLPLASLS